MADPLAALLVLSYAVALLFGGSVSYFSFRAYRRTGAREFGVLCLGVALLTIGLIGHAEFGWALVADGTIRPVVPAVLSATGLGLVLYSLYARGERPDAERTT